MSEELKSERVTTMMTPSEVRIVDDWSFEQRIRSRGEAIRRLIELGLAAAKREKPATEHPPAEPAGKAAGKPPPRKAKRL